MCLSQKIQLNRLYCLLLADEIESLPLANTPEVMGLHSNAEIGYYTQAAKDMWAHLIDLQPQTGIAQDFLTPCFIKEALSVYFSGAARLKHYQIMKALFALFYHTMCLRGIWWEHQQR